MVREKNWKICNLCKVSDKSVRSYFRIQVFDILRWISQIVSVNAWNLNISNILTLLSILECTFINIWYVYIEISTKKVRSEGDFLEFEKKIGIGKFYIRRFQIRNFKTQKLVSMFLSYLVENFFPVILRRRIFFVFEIFSKNIDSKVKFLCLQLSSSKRCKSSASVRFFSANSS